MVEAACSVAGQVQPAQDHSRRGLVAILPEGIGNEEALDWLLRAGTALAAHLKLAGWWRAAIYTR